MRSLLGQGGRGALCVGSALGIRAALCMGCSVFRGALCVGDALD